MIKSEPRFPFPSGPREYQNEAYEAWIKNGHKGIFAMATGTGKTLTSLNCVVEEYKKTSKYNVIILVPTITLVTQWIEEVSKFNFRDVSSTLSKSWESDFKRFYFNLKHGIGDGNFIFISTYATFVKSKFQNIISKLNNEELILIADEVHNLGATRSLKKLPNNINKRIGLSATPERIYDEGGSKKLYDFFNSYSPCYTYSFSMRRAIQEGYLTPYNYYPYFISLEYDELQVYLEISRQLLKHYDFEKERFKDTATPLLIKRKRIIHKAKNKKKTLIKILESAITKEDFDYTFVYVPEGYEKTQGAIEDDFHEIEEEDKRIINDYSKIIHEFGYKTYQFLGETKDRDRILEQFSEGMLDVITAMKALDEGVDVPIAKNAIFCASTGNPRQFIQRRGRVLRKYPGKEYANIYDMIVTPAIEQEDDELRKLEINIFKGELRRVANFLYSSENSMSVLNDKLEDLAEEFDIDIYGMILRNIETDDKC